MSCDGQVRLESSWLLIVREEEELFSVIQISHGRQVVVVFAYWGGGGEGMGVQ